MTGPAAAALLLSAAVMASSPPRRWVSSARRVAPTGVAGWMVGCATAVAAALAAGISPAVLVSASVVATTAAIRQRRYRRCRQQRAEGRALETALDVLVNELRAGAHPVCAVSAAATETGATDVGVAMHAVAARARLGAEVAAGLRSMATGSKLTVYWQRLAQCWQLAGEHGLAISALMRAAQQDIVERQRFAERVAAGMAGARATAAILAALPVLAVLLGQLIGAAPIGVLLGKRFGGWLLMAGVLFACGGLLWADRITDLEAGLK